MQMPVNFYGNIFQTHNFCRQWEKGVGRWRKRKQSHTFQEQALFEVDVNARQGRRTFFNAEDDEMKIA